MVSAAVLNQKLMLLLLAKMRPLSIAVLERIFEGYGPLYDLAPKADLAYAISLIDEDLYHEIRVIKDIRNKFAHSPQLEDFRSDEITKLLQRFKKWNRVIDPYHLFSDRVSNCIVEIEKLTDAMLRP